MNRQGLIIALLALGWLTSQGCSHLSSTPTPSIPPADPTDGFASREEHVLLAGEWEYEEGGVVFPIRLDRFGNGTYEFKDGRFLTYFLRDRHWTGMWAQRDNDREGGFDITLSSDYSEGEGRWWYTRIETDIAPNKPGGTFHVLKVQSTAERQPSPNEPATP